MWHLPLGNWISLQSKKYFEKPKTCVFQEINAYALCFWILNGGFLHFYIENLKNKKFLKIISNRSLYWGLRNLNLIYFYKNYDFLDLSWIFKIAVLRHYLVIVCCFCTSKMAITMWKRVIATFQSKNTIFCTFCCFTSWEMETEKIPKVIFLGITKVLMPPVNAKPQTHFSRFRF